MRIVLSPVAGDRATTVSKTGDVLTIDGVVFDFSPLTEGAILPQKALGADPPIIGDVTRIDGRVIVMIRFVYVASGATEAARFPAPIVDPPDGDLELPR